LCTWFHALGVARFDFLATLLATSSAVGGWARSSGTGRSVGVVGEQLARCARGRVEGVVPGGEENVVAMQLQGAREVDGVVAAQGVLGGEVAGVAGQWFVDCDGA
jgi:hypothetical protein